MEQVKCRVDTLDNIMFLDLNDLFGTAGWDSGGDIVAALAWAADINSGQLGHGHQRDFGIKDDTEKVLKFPTLTNRLITYLDCMSISGAMKQISSLEAWASGILFFYFQIFCLRNWQFQLYL